LRPSLPHKFSTRWLLAATFAVLVLLLAATASTAGAKTVWLCKPGQQPDPCTPSLSTTVYSPKLVKLRVEHPQRLKRPAIDCFYVYPTVSDQAGLVANLNVDPAERSIALYQAARYSQYCRVYAPMYRQLTLKGIAAGRTRLRSSWRSEPRTFAPPSATTWPRTTTAAASS
jgi:Protein of unknown function (DUF3089)